MARCERQGLHGFTEFEGFREKKNIREGEIYIEKKRREWCGRLISFENSPKSATSPKLTRISLCFKSF
jgi:hypothetical protein